MEPDALRLVRELEAQIDASRGARLERLFAPVRSAFSIFAGNAQELGQVVALHSSDRAEPLLYNVRNRALLRAVIQETERRLHNYVASARSLVEHTRQAIRKSYPVRSADRHEYDAHVRAEFAELGESRFVQDLRNFILHVDAPLIRAEWHWERGRAPRRSLLLPREQLDAWSEWSAPALVYLSGITGDVSLEPLVDAYTARVRAFYEWLAEWHRSRHAEAFDELDSLRQRLRQVVIDSGLVDLHDDSTRPRPLDEIWEEIKKARRDGPPDAPSQ